MIKLKTLGGEYIYINEAYIETMEANPNTTIKIHNGTTFVVEEPPDLVVQMIQEWGRTMSTPLE